MNDIEVMQHRRDLNRSFFNVSAREYFLQRALCDLILDGECCGQPLAHLIDEYGDTFQRGIERDSYGDEILRISPEELETLDVRGMLSDRLAAGFGGES